MWRLPCTSINSPIYCRMSKISLEFLQSLRTICDTFKSNTLGNATRCAYDCQEGDPDTCTRIINTCYVLSWTYPHVFVRENIEANTPYDVIFDTLQAEDFKVEPKNQPQIQQTIAVSHLAMKLCSCLEVVGCHRVMRCELREVQPRVE